MHLRRVRSPYLKLSQAREGQAPTGPNAELHICATVVRLQNDHDVQVGIAKGPDGHWLIIMAQFLDFVPVEHPTEKWDHSTALARMEQMLSSFRESGLQVIYQGGYVPAELPHGL